MMVFSLSASLLSNFKKKWNLSLMFFVVVLLILIMYTGTFLYNVCRIEESPKSVVEKYTYLTFPYVKETATTRPMQYFDSQFQYSIKEYPKRSLEEQEKGLLLGMVKKVALKLNILPDDFTDGSYRLLKEGVEFNLFFNGGQKRVVAFQPFTETFQMKEVLVTADQKVNIILPLQGRLSTLVTFLDHLVSKVLPIDGKVTLTVVYFNDDMMGEVRKTLKNKLSDVPFFEWRFIATNDSHFNRGKGIQMGVKAAAKSPFSLVFICDVDVLFTPQFLTRCRANSIYDNQVYFPALFSLHNPELVYGLYEKAVPAIADQLHVTTDNGFWRYFGFGMFCMHKKEYDLVGGVPAFLTWGGEDVKFYQRFGDYANVKVVRSLDPGIYHVFHEKNCTNVARDSYPSCLFSKASNEGTQIHLGMLLFKTQDHLDLEGILSKRFYYTKWIPLLALVCTTQFLMLIALCFKGREGLNFMTSRFVNVHG